VAEREGREFYDAVYGGFRESLSALIRREAFGEDIGQNSWLTADEHRHFFSLLRIDAGSAVLEVASGSGGPALFMAEQTGADVTGVDLHEDGVAAANAAARERGLEARARFLVGDAREALPFADGSFDALECIDSMNHLYERARVLAEFRRVLRPGGRVLFTDPITVTGILRREEMVIRSRGMGEFVFTAPGVDESLLAQAGFVEVEVEDVTANMAQVAASWGAARARQAQALRDLEGENTFVSTQEFLEVVDRLARERRLSRLVYMAVRRG
jgi:SAM-dependent methyltransferase